MADGHARTTGALYRDVRVGGKTYRCRPFNFGVYPEMEAFIVSERQDPLIAATLACQSAPPSLHETIWKVAMERACKARTATSQEIQDFETSLLGIAFKFWVCVRQDHPEIKDPRQIITDIFANLTDADMRLLETEVFVASGEADLGNSTGHPEVSPPTSPAGGPQPIENLPKPTDGQTPK